jgi:uncharacterized protein (TIGR03086 family)
VLPAVTPGQLDQATADAVAELQRPGAMEQAITLPFGSFTGEQVMGLGVLDTFQHAWDLATATGQDTDLAPEMAAALLVQAELHVAQTSRGPEPAPYGPIQTAPTGASTADQLAAFLGRTF